MKNEKLQTVKIQIRTDITGEKHIVSLVSISDAAKILGKKSLTSVLRLVEKGEIRYAWVSNTRAFFLVDIKKVLEKQNAKK